MHLSALSLSRPLMPQQSKANKVSGRGTEQRLLPSMKLCIVAAKQLVNYDCTVPQIVF
jgi:hypothetical protein